MATKDGIRYGMYAIKSIGRQVIDIILAEREANGKYITLSDFLSRVAGRRSISVRSKPDQSWSLRWIRRQQTADALSI